MVLQAPERSRTTEAELNEAALLEQLLQEEEPLIERGSLRAIDPKQLPHQVVHGLSHFLTPEHLTGPARWLYRPILFSAVGLHALLFFWPGKAPDKQEIKEKEQPVTITQITTGKVAPKLDKPVTAKIQPPKPKLPKIDLPNPKPPIVKPSPKPTPEATKQAESADQPKPKAQPTPSSAQASTDLPPVQPGDSIDPNNPFADFPHLGQKNAAEEYEVKSSQLNTAAAHFIQKLPTLKYTIDVYSEEAGRKTFRFAKGGKEAFLNIFQEDGNVIYILANTEVKSLEVWRGSAKVPDDLVGLIGALPLPPGVSDGSQSSTPAPEDFATPDQFFNGPDQFKPEIGGVSPRVVLGYDPQTLYNEQLQPDLERIFEISSVGEYGGGPLWELKKGKTKLYLNLVPRVAGDGTSIIFWTQSPS